MKLLQKSKDLLKKVFGWCRSHKFLTVVIVVGFISAAAFAAGRKKLFDTMNPQQQTSYSFVRTTTLQKNGLEQSVNATGSVESANTSTVSYSSQGGAKIKTINVSVGDTVKKGDIVAVLDSTDIQESIAKEQEALAERVEKAYKAYTDAQTEYNSATEQYNSSKAEVSSAAAKLNSAQKEYENAAASISNFQKAYDDAAEAEAKAIKEYNDALTDYESKYAAAKSEYDTAKAAYDAAVTARENAEKAYNDALQQNADAENTEVLMTNAENDDETDCSETEIVLQDTAAAATDTLYAQLETAKTNEADALQKVNDAQAALQALDKPQADYQEAQDKTKQAQAALNTAKASSKYDSCYSAYTQAQNSYNSAVTSCSQAESKMNSAKEAVDTAYENYLDSQTSETLENLNEQLADCNLVAETNGKITSLNATVGGTANGTIAQIMDTDSLKISITISEADINDVVIGMKCKIRSDATDGEISGTLTQIDPVSGQGGSFGAEVTVNMSGTGLLIGMNADVDIIISETEDCFTVPVDAVGDDGDGLGSYILRKTAGEGVEMEFEKVYVTTGESNDYYIEVNADSLAAGDVIRSYSDLSIGIEEVTGDDAQAAMGIENLIGGMDGFGGTMPSDDNFGGNGGRSGGSMPDFEGSNGGGNMPGGNGGNGGFGGGGQ